MNQSSATPPQPPGSPPANPFKPAWAIIAVLLAICVMLGVRAAFRPDEIIQWRTDFASAAHEAQLRNEPRLLYFTADYCGPCQEMRHSTWAAPRVKTALQHYVPVKIDFDAHRKLDQQFGVQAMPTMIVVDPQGRVLRATVGEMSAAEFLQWLQQPPMASG